MDSFGRRLAQLRRDLGITQEDLRARMQAESGVNVGQTYISQMERQNKMPSLEVATALARALKTSVDYLALLTDDSTPHRETGPQFFTPEADEMAQIVDTLPADVRLVALSVVRSIAAQSEAAREARRRELADMLTSIERNAGSEARRVIERQLGLGGRTPASQP